MKSSLNNYLQKKLTVSNKEAELIKSVYKQYIQEKKRNKYEEISWEGIKSTAKSLIGKGNKSTFLLEGISKQTVYKLMVEVITLPSDRLLSDNNLHFTGLRDKRKDVLAYFNSLGVSYDKNLIDTWEKTTDEVIQFFKPLITADSSREMIFDIPKVCDILEINPTLYSDFEIDSYIHTYISYGIYKDKHDDALNGYLLKRSLNHNATKVSSSSLATPEDMKKMVENIGYLKGSITSMSNKFKSIKNAIKEKFDELFVENNNPDKRKINQLGKNKLYFFFKSFYPSESMAEFNQKIGIDKKVIAQSSKDVMPTTQENMKSMMSAKEKKVHLQSNRLGKFLEKRLTISKKESQIIESVIKDYVKKKSMMKEEGSLGISEKKIKETGLNKAGFVRNKRIPNYDYETEEGMTSLDSNYSNFSDKFTNYPEELYSSDEEGDESSKEEFYDRHPELPRPRRRK